MASTDGTILDRAVRSWEESPFAYLYPVFASQQPEQYELARRIAEVHRGSFENELVALLASPNAIVVVQALTILKWMKSPVLAELSDELLADRRWVTIGGCLLVRKTVGQIARDCARAQKNAAAS